MSDPRPAPTPDRTANRPDASDRRATGRLAADRPLAANGRLAVRPWLDPFVDRTGVDPRSRYAETYWLPIVGPTAMWVLRQLSDRFDHEPDGYVVDLERLAAGLGLSYAKGTRSPLARAIQRLVLFGLAHTTSDGLAVRRRVPAIALRHLRRLPADLQAAHDDVSRRSAA